MAFPYDSGGAPNSMQGVLVGVADVSASGQGMLRVSTMNSISVTAISANQQLSAKLLEGTAFVGDVSAVQGSADQLRTSTIQGDAGLFRVSAIGGTAGDRTLVDGTTQTISATLTPVSASPAGTVQGLVVNSFQYDAGKQLVSAKSGDANQVHVSSVQGDAGLLRTSSLNQDANFMHVSGFSPDAGLFRVSGIQGDGSLFRVSALQSAITTNTGGTSFYWVSSGAGGQVSTVKSSGGRLYGWYIGNPAGVDQYLQIFNTSGGAQAGTDAPSMTFYVPTLGGANMAFPPGIAMSNGIQIVGTSTVNGNSMGASAMRINIFYA